MSEQRSTVVPGKVERVADGVYAYVQPPGGWCVNNAGIVVDHGETALVDTAATEARTRALRAEVKRLSPEEPTVLINTHHHSDHTFGNVLFDRRTSIIAHETTRSEVIANGLGLQRLWPDVEWGQVGVRAPTITFQDRLSVHVGHLRLELITVGPAHTRTDVVVWIPDRRVLFAGDVVMSDVTPFALMGSISGSLRALDTLRRLDPAVVVPGHGPVTGPGVIEENAAYFRLIRDLAREGRARRRDPLVQARRTDLGRFASWLDSERLVANLRRGYAEDDGLAPGEPLDIMEAMNELVTFHGSVPDCHA